MKGKRLLQPAQVSETVSFSSAANYEERRSISYLDFVIMKRFNEGVNLVPQLTPTSYRDTVTCYINSTKRRFKSQTLYETKVKPRYWSDTLIVFPKRPQKSYVTCLDYHIDECRRWFKTTMEFKAQTYTTSKVITPDGEAVDGSVGSESDNSDSEGSVDYASECEELVSTHAFPAITDSSDGPGASQIFLPRWNRDGADDHKHIPHLVNGELILNGF